MKRFALLSSVLLLAGCGWWGIPAGVRTPSGPARQVSSGCGLSMSGTYISYNSRLLSAELPDGALVIGSSRRKGSKLVISLRRVNPDCQVLNLPRASVQVGRFGGIDTMTATPQAELLLGGSDGRHALVGRLMATGRPDQTFGHRGWIRLTPHEKTLSGMPPPAFVATSIAVGPSGSIFVGGNDGGAHCCVRDFVSDLTPAGNVVRTLFPRNFGGSYTTDVYANDDGSVYALGEYEQSGCGGPSIVRIRRDGSLDPGFDATISRTIKKVMSARSLRFTPTLVPAGAGGAFLLVGGLDTSCVRAGREGPLGSSGVTVAVNASGQMSHALSRFASPNYAFDSPAALWLPSGRTLVAAVAYTANGGRPQDVLVQSLAPGGVPSGVQRVPLPKAGRGTTASIALFPGAAGYTRLVIALRTEIDVTPVPSGG